MDFKEFLLKEYRDYDNDYTEHKLSRGDNSAFMNMLDKYDIDYDFNPRYNTITLNADMLDNIEFEDRFDEAEFDELRDKANL